MSTAFNIEFLTFLLFEFVIIFFFLKLFSTPLKAYVTLSCSFVGSFVLVLPLQATSNKVNVKIKKVKKYLKDFFILSPP